MAPPDRDDAKAEEGPPPASMASARTLPALGVSEPPPDASLGSARTVFDTNKSGPEAASGERVLSSGSPVVLRPFGPYSQVVALSAQGSMGWVARGFNEGFGRWELLKFLRPELASEVELIRQFMREGRVLAKLSHPNVVQVFAMYSLEGHACLAMEWLEGQSLSELVAERGGRLSSEETLPLLVEAARGLAAAHELGLLHRDIKPDNLFVVTGGRGRERTLKLIDFGLATADRGRPETLMNDPNLDSNAVGGTPLFLSPELWKGQTASPQSDLYALGVTFYHALTGAYPSGPLGIRGLMEYAKSGERAPRVRDARPDAMPGLAGLVDRLIAKDPAQRPESAALLLHELLALEETARPRRLPGTGPFRGLLPYGESERDVFFGRDAEIAEITERLRSSSAVVLVGPPGSGKTSLALAGVVPRIREGVLGGGIRFAVAVVEPSRRPLRALAAALSTALGGDESELQRAFDESALAAQDVVRRRLAGAAGLLLVVDPLEELLRRPEHSGEARRFAEIVARLADTPAPDLRVLCALQVEELDELLAAFDLKQMFARGFVPVMAPSASALAHAAERALGVAGYSADDPELLAKLGQELGTLRHGAWLFGLTLAQAWRERDETGKRLKLRELEAQGGFAALLVRHADSVILAMGDKQRALAEDLLSRFVSAERRAQRVLRASLLEWQPEAAAVLSVLLEGRVLVELGDELELVHPLLIERWKFLQAAVASHGEDKVLRERVAAAAREWDAQGRPDGALWHGEQADSLVAWFLATEARFGELELEFIGRVRNQGRRRRWLRRIAIGVGVSLLALIAAIALIGRRDLRAELDAEREKSKQARTRQRTAMQAAELRVAELELEGDPLAALRAAHRSRALGESPKLDAIGWAARRRGVPMALPLHPGGAGGVRLGDDERHVLTWGSEALHVLEIGGEGRERFAMPEALPPTALVALADGAVFGNVRGELFRAVRGGGAPRKLGACSGVVRRIVVREAGRRLRILCSNQEQSEYAAHELELGGGALRPLWNGAARVVELDRHGERLAAASGSRLSGWAEAGDAPAANLEGERTVTALAWLGKEPLLGAQSGELTRGSLSARGHDGAVLKIAVAADEQRIVTLGDDGRAILWNAALERIADFPASGRAVAFLDVYAAVAVESPSHHVHVASSSDGLPLADFGPATRTVTALASTGEWLFASSLDGATRAFALHATLPRRKQSLLRGNAAGRCALSVDGRAVGCVSEQRLDLAPLPGGTGQKVGLELAAEMRPDLARPLAVGAAGNRAAWVASGELAVYGGEKVTLERGSGAVEWLSPTPEDGVWLVTRRLGERRTLSVVGRTNAPPPVTLAAAPRLVSFGGDGAVYLLDSAGKLYEARALEGPYDSVLVSDVAGLSAVAAASGSHLLLYGTESGQLGTLDPSTGKATTAARREGAIVSITSTREDRAVVVSDSLGKVALVDLETGMQTPLFGIGATPATCALDQASGFVGCGVAQGATWRLALDTTPLGFSVAPEDPLDPKTRPLAGWRGLGTHD
jgi:serine/threonine protein kinase